MSEMKERRKEDRKEEKKKSDAIKGDECVQQLEFHISPMGLHNGTATLKNTLVVSQNS